jgi:hypothetical protein
MISSYTPVASETVVFGLQKDCGKSQKAINVSKVYFTKGRTLKLRHKIVYVCCFSYSYIHLGMHSTNTLSFCYIISYSATMTDNFYCLSKIPFSFCSCCKLYGLVHKNHEAITKRVSCVAQHRLPCDLLIRLICCMITQPGISYSALRKSIKHKSNITVIKQQVRVQEAYNSCFIVCHFHCCYCFVTPMYHSCYASKKLMYWYATSMLQSSSILIYTCYQYQFIPQ